MSPTTKRTEAWNDDLMGFGDLVGDLFELISLVVFDLVLWELVGKRMPKRTHGMIT